MRAVRLSISVIAMCSGCGCRDSDPAPRPAPAEAAPATPPWPEARGNHVAVWDAQRQQMILFGGDTAGSEVAGDAWILDLSGSPTWSRVDSPGPPARRSHSGVWDPTGNRMIVFAGQDAAGDRNDTWTLSTRERPPRWRELAPAELPPPARRDHCAAWSARRRLFVVDGGITGGQTSAETWIAVPADDKVSWRRLTPGGDAPPPRSGHACVADDERDRIIVYGGEAADVWVLDLAAEPPAWSKLAVEGTVPAPRIEHSAVWDPARKRLIAYGGLHITPVTGGEADWHYEYHRDAPVLDLSGPVARWSDLGPAVRSGYVPRAHTAVFDAPRERIVLFGGIGMYASSQLWILNLGASWTEVPGGKPTPFTEQR